MSETETVDNPAYEPAPSEIGCCRRCDCDISIPDAKDGLCAVCAARDDEVVG